MSREAGKGDSLRPTDLGKFSQNWDKINWNKSKDGIQQIQMVQQGEDTPTPTEVSASIEPDSER
jgi:hypothetical protein